MVATALMMADQKGKTMRKTGLIFNWKDGSKYDNVTALLIKNRIPYHYDHFGRLEADFYGIGTFYRVGFEKVGNDVFEICANI